MKSSLLAFCVCGLALVAIAPSWAKPSKMTAAQKKALFDRYARQNNQFNRFSILAEERKQKDFKGDKTHYGIINDAYPGYLTQTYVVAYRRGEPFTHKFWGYGYSFRYFYSTKTEKITRLEICGQPGAPRTKKGKIVTRYFS